MQYLHCSKTAVRKYKPKTDNKKHKYRLHLSNKILPNRKLTKLSNKGSLQGPTISIEKKNHIGKHTGVSEKTKPNI